MAFAQGAQAGAAVRRNRLFAEENRLLERQNQTQNFVDNFVKPTQALNQDLAKNALGIIQAGRADTPEGRRLLETIRNTVRDNLLTLENRKVQFFGGTPDLAQERAGQALLAFDSLLAGGQTQADTARQEAQAQVAGAEAAAQAATAAGIETTPQQTLQAAGVIPAPEAANIQNFQMPDGSIQAVDTRNSEAVQAAIDGGGRRVTLSVQAESLEGLRATTQAGASPSEVTATRQGLQNITENIRMAQDVLGDFAQNPEAGGITGEVIDSVGGIFQQIEELVGAEGTFEDITGADPARVAQIRSDAFQLTSRLLPTIINEESGRYTDRERADAQTALRALTPSSSTQQITSVLRSTLGTMQRSQVRFANNLRLQADISNDALATDEGVLKFVALLRENGFREQDIVEIIEGVRADQGITFQ